MVILNDNCGDPISHIALANSHIEVYCIGAVHKKGDKIHSSKLKVNLYKNQSWSVTVEFLIS